MSSEQDGAFVLRGHYRKDLFEDVFWDGHAELVLMAKPPRTINQFLQEDLVPTVHFVRGRYIPDVSDSEKLKLEQSIEWAKENMDFLQTESLGDIYKNCPDFLSGNVWTSIFLAEFGDQEYSDSKVAFKPRTWDWKVDLYTCTIWKFNSLQSWVLGRGRSLLGDVWASRSSRVLGEFFLSRGRASREEAMDVITCRLLNVYFLELRHRESVLLRGQSK